MRIYRFTPQLAGFAHPARSLAGRWWPPGVDLGPVMETLHDLSAWGCHPHASGHYPLSPQELEPSDFPVLSWQVPVVSERAAAVMDGDLRARLRPVTIGRARCYAVQPLLASQHQPSPFLAQESTGIRLPRGETVHFHTRVFDPARVRGEFFTIPDHEPYAETYVTGDLVDRARDAGLTGLEGLELVFDDGPVPPAGVAGSRDVPEHGERRELEWELFQGRGAWWSYLDSELREVFDGAVAAGLLTA